MGICIEPNYIEGCSSYLNQNECAQCSEKYELSEGYCNYYGNDAQDHIPGCLTIDRLGKCRNCAIGFYFIIQDLKESMENVRKA